MSRSTIALMTLFCLRQALAASVPETPAPSEATESVTVSGHREALSELRLRLVKLQEHIYADYNKLNPHHQYDIVCTTDAAAGSRIVYRRCLPLFVRSAYEDKAQDAAHQMHLGGYPAPPVSMVVARLREEFKKNYRKVVNSDPELLKLDREYGELAKRYEAISHEKFRGTMAY